jgi:hypothetical protein
MFTRACPHERIVAHSQCDVWRSLSLPLLATQVARALPSVSRYGLRGHRGVNAALFASQSYVRRRRTERRTGMRLLSLGDADIGVLSGRSKGLAKRRADPAAF